VASRIHSGLQLIRPVRSDILADKQGLTKSRCGTEVREESTYPSVLIRDRAARALESSSLGSPPPVDVHVA
jgi:hypothetical protein